jgi:hypothetical protein
MIFEIAQNGFYIPIINTEGKLIFTPKMYEDLRATFAGLERFDADPLEVKLATDTESAYGQKINELAQQIDEDKIEVSQRMEAIQSILREILSEEGITLKSKYDHGLLGADLSDTGSTGRHTNRIGDYDFDLSLKLDDTDMTKVPGIVKKIVDTLGGTDNNSSGNAGDGYYQLRLTGCKLGGDTLDIDIGFTKKSELTVFASHNSIQEKLTSIEKNLGHEAYLQTIANIVLAKQILSEGNAYKKGDHADDGMGGIGVENWILSNKGNMIEAFTSFWKASHDEKGDIISLDDFRKRYRILDAGYNIKFGNHDNYVYVLKNRGYMAMIATIGRYLESTGIEINKE